MKNKDYKNFQRNSNYKNKNKNSPVLNNYLHKFLKKIFK